MAGPSRELPRDIAGTEVTILPFVQVLVAAHHGLHNAHGLLSDIKADFCVFIDLSPKLLDIIVSPGVMAALNQARCNLSLGLMTWEHLSNICWTDLNDGRTNHWVWYRFDHEIV